MLRLLKNRIKERFFASIGVDYNPHGVPFELGKYLRPSCPISLIDVGAHEGAFTRALDRLCGVKSGVLVELQPARAANLRRDFLPPRFQVVECALSDVPGELAVDINSSDATTSILKTRRNLPELSALNVQVAAKITCRTLTLDTIFAQAGLGRLDLLKLDVQGAEHLVIKGGRTALSSTRMVWTEISFKRLYEGSSLYFEVFDLLQMEGFSLFEVAPSFRSSSGELVQADALFVKT